MNCIFTVPQWAQGISGIVVPPTKYYDNVELIHSTAYAVIPEFSKHLKFKLETEGSRYGATWIYFTPVWY